jgi:AcrR family transcriptional regulator
MRLPAPRRRHQLLDVARELFAAGGFHATSMDDVAEAAGVTKPVLYQHFPSKRALYRELLEDVGARLMAEITAAAAPADRGRERVQNGMAAYFRFVTGNQPAFRLLFGASVRNDAEFAEVASTVLEHMSMAVAEMLDVDLPTEQKAVLAHAVIGMAEAVGRRALRDESHEQDPELLAHWTAELVWYGLRGIRTGSEVATPGGRVDL